MFRLAELQKKTQQHLQPVLLVPLEVPLKVAKQKSMLITFELKVHARKPAGSPNSGSTLHKICRRFGPKI